MANCFPLLVPRGRSVPYFLDSICFIKPNRETGDEVIGEVGISTRIGGKKVPIGRIEQ